MINRSNLSHIKRSQKESALLQALSTMILQISLDDPELTGMTINRVALSKNKGTCLVYFYDPAGIDNFNKKKHRLILYKPSLRKGVAHAMDGRYTPELKFVYDHQYEKQQKIEFILDTVKKDFDKNLE